MQYGLLRAKVLHKPKGTYAYASWGKELQTRAEYKDYKVEKLTSGNVRTGIDYNNKKSTISKRENGELPNTPQALTWGEWLEFPHFISHKGKTYLRINTDKNNPLTSQYFINGKVATKEQAQALCLAKEFPSSNKETDTFSVNTDNIIDFR